MESDGPEGADVVVGRVGKVAPHRPADLAMPVLPDLHHPISLLLGLDDAVLPERPAHGVDAAPLGLSPESAEVLAVVVAGQWAGWTTMMMPPQMMASETASAISDASFMLPPLGLRVS
jgi:hypothetical protein